MIAFWISSLSLFACSMLVGNGFSPVFAVMGETRRSRMPWAGLAAFFATKLAVDAGTGVLGFTWVQYPVWAVTYFAAHKGGLVAATVFYVLSNSLCFWQMIGSPYPPTWAGYWSCMAAGLPYYLRSLLATLLFSALFAWLRHVLPLRWRHSLCLAEVGGI